VKNRSLSLLLGEAELAERAAAARQTEPAPGPKQRGYRKLFLQSVTQADEGCDFDFLRAPDMTDSVPKPRADDEPADKPGGIG
jgi:dihydroxy-acid dehydratase